ncbi:MAG: DUF1569 domain-containing protein [Gemmatimonadota bacterium]|nr:DUF1569 domain-containing protein [Gemmatimonadota bacterium]
MTTLTNAQTREKFAKRISLLTTHTKNRWGRMSVEEMVAHLNAAFEVSFGRIQMTPQKTLMRLAPLKFLLIYVVPWPKGKARAPREYLPPPQKHLESEKSRLIDLIEEFAQTNPANLNAPHPLFGKMTARQWDALHRKHLEHHLTQFGV